MAMQFLDFAALMGLNPFLFSKITQHLFRDFTACFTLIAPMAKQNFEVDYSRDSEIGAGSNFL
jgi:hypothetical protein